MLRVACCGLLVGQHATRNKPHAILSLLPSLASWRLGVPFDVFFQNSPEANRMRDYRLVAGIIVAVAFLHFSSIAWAGTPARNNQTRLEREIAALTAIDDFGLTDDQLKSIQPMCKESNDKAAATTAPAASDAYRGALRSLREALVHGDED